MLLDVCSSSESDSDDEKFLVRKREKISVQRKHWERSSSSEEEDHDTVSESSCEGNMS